MITPKKPHLIRINNYSIEIAAINPTHLFVFGDNLKRIGTGPSSGQAVVRGATNSFGIATKREPNNNEESFFSDKKEEFEALKADVLRLAREIKSGKWEAIVFPVDGFGTGRAQLQQKSPKIFEAMNKLLDQLVDQLLCKEDEVVLTEIDAPKEVRLAVVGSRGFSDYALMKEKLDEVMVHKPFDVIVSGGANGADTLSERWAAENNVKTLILKPDWEKYGKRAGFVRNVNIWDNADFGIAFWDGESKGTAHSFEIAKKQNKEILIVNYASVLKVDNRLHLPLDEETLEPTIFDKEEEKIAPQGESIDHQAIFIAESESAKQENISTEVIIELLPSLEERLLGMSPDEKLAIISSLSKEDKKILAMDKDITKEVSLALCASTYMVNKMLWFNPSVSDEVKDELAIHFKKFPHLYDSAFFRGEGENPFLVEPKLLQEEQGDITLTRVSP